MEQEKNQESEHDKAVIPTDLPKVDRDRMKKAGIVLIVLLVVLFLIGWVPRLLGSRRTDRDQKELQQGVIQVQVTKPKRNTADRNLTLPGNTRAFQETAIFPRANGYLKELFVDIGDMAATDKVLATIDSPELDSQLVQAQADLQKSKNDFDLARATLVRYEGFAKTGGVTRQQLDERKSADTQAESALAGAQANVQRLTDLQKFEKVVAPFPGVITARNYDVGALLSATTSAGDRALFQIARTDVLRVFVNVPQSYVTSIAIGQEASLLVRNYPGREFKGKVARTAGALDDATRTLNTEVDIPNPDGTLFAGMYGEVKFVLNNAVEPWIIPTSAIIFDASGTRVGTVADGKIHFKTVTLDRDYGQEIEVSDGLDGTEDVVTNPGQRMAEGAPAEAHQQQQSSAASSSSMSSSAQQSSGQQGK